MPILHQWPSNRSYRRIPDALLSVVNALSHIMTPTRAHLHKLTPFARVRCQSITYPPNRATRPFETKSKPDA